jgi:ABC-type Fe3+-citrate transport system substrate-binding protein
MVLNLKQSRQFFRKIYKIMNRQTMIVLLVLVALASVAYGIYRSTDQKTIITQGGLQTIYGEPQHGLILGLCILAGLCILDISPLLLVDRNRYDIEERAREASERKRF